MTPDLDILEGPQPRFLSVKKNKSKVVEIPQDSTGQKVFVKKDVEMKDSTRMWSPGGESTLWIDVSIPRDLYPVTA